MPPPSLPQSAEQVPTDHSLMCRCFARAPRIQQSAEHKEGLARRWRPLVGLRAGQHASARAAVDGQLQSLPSGLIRRRKAPDPEVRPQLLQPLPPLVSLLRPKRPDFSKVWRCGQLGRICRQARARRTVRSAPICSRGVRAAFTLWHTLMEHAACTQSNRPRLTWQDSVVGQLEAGAGGEAGHAAAAPAEAAPLRAI